MEHPRGCLDLEAQSLFRGELAGVAHGATAEPDEFAPPNLLGDRSIAGAGTQLDELTGWLHFHAVSNCPPRHQVFKLAVRRTPAPA